VRRAVLIVNPYSTNVDRERVGAVERALRARVDVDTAFTEGPGHATQLAAEAAARTEAIVVFSGDGTYNEVLNGIDGAVPVGFLPGGGTSVFARALGLPRDPVRAAARVADALAERRTRRISLGCVNGRRFCFSAGIGIDAEGVRRLNALGRGPGGARPGDLRFARVFASMVAERRGRWPDALEVEGYGRAAFVLVANGDPYTYAGPVPLHVAPEARFELGLDFVAPTRVLARDVPRLLALLLRRGGRRSGPALLVGHDLDRIEVRCDRPLPLQADGEDLGDVDTALFEAQRDAVDVLV
jgi:diacylglycerol kinase family enzyme